VLIAATSPCLIYWILLFATNDLKVGLLRMQASSFGQLVFATLQLLAYTVFLSPVVALWAFRQTQQLWHMLPLGGRIAVSVLQIA